MPAADSPTAPRPAGRAAPRSCGPAPPAAGGRAVWRLVAAGSGRIGLLRGRGLRAACALGAGGVRRDKREGDGATPAGCWPVRRLRYRAGRVPCPATALPAGPTRPRDGWCDDSGHPAYNRAVRLPVAASAERLQRPDRLYDLVLELGYNDSPPMPFAGSAIFMHVARPGLRPTAGCIALPRHVLQRVLARMRPGDRILVQCGRAGAAGAE